MATVEIHDLHKSFGPQKVLDGVDLAVERGETLVVLGRSGTGKSVLLKLIIGLTKPDSGSIQVAGQDIAGLEINQLKSKHEKTFVVVTHDIRGARMYADRMLLIDQGRVRAEGSFEDLNNSKDEFVSRFMGDSS